MANNFSTKTIFALFLSLSFLIFTTSSVFATTITVASPSIAITSDEFVPIFIPWMGTTPLRGIDSPLVSYVVNGTRYWMQSIGSVHAKYRGSLSKPLTANVWQKPTETLFLDPKNQGLGGPWRQVSEGNWTYDGGAQWIVNIYQISDSELLAFMHVEQSALVNGAYTTGRSSLALARSNDGGESYTYLGEIIRYNGTSPEYNVQGTPYIIKDGYFYIYYHDFCPGHATTIARAPVTDVLDSARHNATSPWKKYYQGSWESDGLGGPCTPANIEKGIDHTDAMYSTYTNKYYLLLSMMAWGRPDSWIKLYESQDTINWTFVGDIVKEDVPPSEGYQNVSVIDESGSDNAVVGKNFYVYSGKNSGSSQTIYRWLVSLNDETRSFKPGDLNTDGKVDIFDYNLLVSKFGNPYTIFDYNNLVANYGK